jgi:hypothetical protein
MCLTAEKRGRLQPTSKKQQSAKCKITGMEKEKLKENLITIML